MNKISFSLSSNQSSSKSNAKTKNPQINRESIPEFDPSQTLTLEKGPKKIAIPPKQNEWRPAKKMKNLDLPPIHSEGKPLEFEVEIEADVVAPESESKISYGLNLRQDAVDGKGEFDVSNSIDAIMLKKLRNNLDKLPEDEGFDQFEEVPVEGFGEALLAGYGWRQGMGIGRNAKEDFKVVEYKRRNAKEGLGFSDDDVVPKKVDGRDNKNKGKFEVGKEVRIIGGRKMGYKGRVIEVLRGSLFLRLSRSDEEVKVRVDEVAELGSLEEDKCLKELKIRGSKESLRGSDKKGSRDSSSERKESKSGRNEDRRGDVGEVKSECRVRVDEERTSSSRVSWLRSHIRVRIVSKSFKGGKFYLKKGVVIDAAGVRTCDISMDDGREIVQGVEQEILETALPRRGGPVLVLFGNHKGTYGSLVEKDSERGTGVVQDADTHELIHVQLEQIAEFVGDPGDIGY
ncbi:protein MOS2-like [Chenopodium quinoa]|uniref:G-patch domain-containing protein n=1 Tax=Chenopodium quinoa TaxID=63459 RepID=A0A803L9I6_CHEQI|nr:protein MOS2-like [Chenopodium quinoa]